MESRFYGTIFTVIPSTVYGFLLLLSGARRTCVHHVVLWHRNLLSSPRGLKVRKQMTITWKQSLDYLFLLFIFLLLLRWSGEFSACGRCLVWWVSEKMARIWAWMWTHQENSKLNSLQCCSSITCFLKTNSSSYTLQLHICIINCICSLHKLSWSFMTRSLDGLLKNFEKLKKMHICILKCCINLFLGGVKRINLHI